MFKSENFKQMMVIIGSLIVLVVLLLLQEGKKDKTLGFFTEGFQNPSVVTQKTIAPALTGYQGDGTATASSTLILLANEARSYVRCTNLSGPFGGIGSNGIPISVMLGTNATLGYGATSTGNYGIVLAPIASSSANFFEINGDNQFTGSIYASALATTTISCIQN